MAFWSAARLLVTSFFCSFTHVSSNTLTHVRYLGNSYLGLLSLLEESLLASLLLSLVGGEVLGLGNLLNLGLIETGKVNLV